MASPRTGSAPPSEAKVKFERYTPDGGGSIKKQRALPPQKRYQRFSEQEWKTNIIGTMTSAAFLGNFFVGSVLPAPSLWCRDRRAWSASRCPMLRADRRTFGLLLWVGFVAAKIGAPQARWRPGSGGSRRWGTSDTRLGSSTLCSRGWWAAPARPRYGNAGIIVGPSLHRSHLHITATPASPPHHPPRQPTCRAPYPHACIFFVLYLCPRLLDAGRGAYNPMPWPILRLAFPGGCGHGSPPFAVAGRAKLG